MIREMAKIEEEQEEREEEKGRGGRTLNRRQATKRKLDRNIGFQSLLRPRVTSSDGGGGGRGGGGGGSVGIGRRRLGKKTDVRGRGNKVKEREKIYIMKKRRREKGG